MPIAKIAQIIAAAVKLVLADPTPPMEISLCEANPSLVFCPEFRCDTDADCHDKCVADMEALGEYGGGVAECDEY